MNNSIFGSAAPKVQLGSTTVILNYWVPSSESHEPKEVIVESELSAYRRILDHGDYLTFEGTINLLKYGSLSDIRAKFEEIYALNKQNVYLWKHSDGQPYKDRNGDNVLFYMKVTPRNLQSLDYRDLLFISLRSLAEVDYSDSSIIKPIVSDIIMS